MQRTFNDVLFTILVIINYPSSKEKFVREFERLNHIETFVNLLERLPILVQYKIKISENKFEEIKKYLSTEEYRLEITKVSIKALVTFISAVSPLITLDQKQKIIKLLEQ